MAASRTSPSPVTSGGRSKTLADLDTDSVAHCASFLDPPDLAHMAMTCTFFRRVAYSDPIWSRFFRERWPMQPMHSNTMGMTMRDAYLARHAALQQFKFLDPQMVTYSQYGSPCSHILLDKCHVFLAKGSSLQKYKFGGWMVPSDQIMRAHNARITCMRLFPFNDTCLGRSASQDQDTVLVTSSADHTIRMWWKGNSQRCFKGHTSPVTALADQLLGSCGSKVLASGGEDGTVRLWSFSSSGKRHPLKTTFYGHEKSISSLLTAGHNPSLLVSVSKDAKIRVWDANVSSSRSSSCVGMTSVSGQPIGMRCHEAMCYVGAGSFVTAIDLRTMQKVFIAAAHPPVLYSFGMLSTKSLICTGGKDRAILWDIRNHAKKEVVDLEGHVGHIATVHMDSYKIVTGGPHDPCIKVWETDTGVLSNTLECYDFDDPEGVTGLSAMAVDGCRIVTAGYEEGTSIACLRDFSNCSIPLSLDDSKPFSKFWDDPS